MVKRDHEHGPAHTVHIMDGYMYLNGCAAWSPGGILIFDLADPEYPVYKGEFAGNYVHDCFVRNDTIYGAGIYGQGINIIDATVKTAPTLVRNISYPGAGTHNTATTTDGGYVLSTDEIGSTAKTLKIWDLATDAMVAEYVGSPTAIVHNVFVKDSLAIMAYYSAGIRVVDISNPAARLRSKMIRTANDDYGYEGRGPSIPIFHRKDHHRGQGIRNVRRQRRPARHPLRRIQRLLFAYGDQPGWTDPTQKADGSPLEFQVYIYRGNTYIAEVDSGIKTFVDAGLNNH